MDLSENKKRVLVVEDDIRLRILISLILKKNGYDAIGIGTGSEAITLIAEDKEVVVLLDYKLPDMTGRDVIIDLEKQGIKVPFIMMTGLGDEFLATEMMKLGAYDYLVKNVDFISLLPETLDKVFKKVETEKEAILAEESFKASKEKLQSLFTEMNDVIVVIDSSGKYVDIAPTRPDFYYLPSSQLLGKRIDDIFQVEKASLFHSIINLVLKTQTRQALDYELEINGQSCWFSARVSPYGSNSVLWIARDITKRKVAEKALRESELRYKLVTTLSGQIVYEYNVLSKSLIWGGAIEEVSGYSYEDYKAFDINKWIQLIHPEDREKTLALFNQALTTNSAINTECRFKHKSGDYIWLEIQFFAFALSGAPSNKIVGVMKDITNRKKYDVLILDSIISTEERERLSFSQELHDGLGPLLSAMKMYVQLMGKSDRKMPFSEIIADIEKLIDEASETVRELSFKLSPHIINHYGLSEAIRLYAQKISEIKNINFVVEDKSLCIFENKKSETILYRVLCECINNTIKYAEAKNIRIDIYCDNYFYIVKYMDDGKGFDVDEVKAGSNGLGLLNIQNRIKSINGFFEIQSKPGKGFYVEIKIRKENKVC